MPKPHLCFIQKHPAVITTGDFLSIRHLSVYHLSICHLSVYQPCRSISSTNIRSRYCSAVAIRTVVNPMESRTELPFSQSELRKFFRISTIILGITPGSSRRPLQYVDNLTSACQCRFQSYSYSRLLLLATMPLWDGCSPIGAPTHKLPCLFAIDDHEITTDLT